VSAEPRRQRGVAESFGSNAQRYDRARPAYPGALVEAIIAASPGRDMLDVGCGTGLAARQFQAAGCTVLGVEPDPRMAALARRNEVEVEVARFETWDSAGRDFDVVISGSAWHWVDSSAGVTKAAQVLRPGGRLAPFYHVFQAPPAVIEALFEACRRVAPDLRLPPRWASRQSAKQPLDVYQRPFSDGIRQAGGFSEPEQWQFEWTRSCTRDDWLDGVPTYGPLNLFPPDKLVKVQEDVAAAIDAMGGSFTIPYTTVAITATRITSA
jgi:SAM-dependent methyltransferase